jgi:hypothetical protein
MVSRMMSAKSVRNRNWFTNAISRLTDPKDLRSGLVVAGLLLVFESVLTIGIIYNVPCMCMNDGDDALHCWVLETEELFDCIVLAERQRQTRDRLC